MKIRTNLLIGATLTGAILALAVISYGWKPLQKGFEGETESRVTFTLEQTGDQVKLTMVHDEMMPGGVSVPVGTLRLSRTAAAPSPSMARSRSAATCSRSTCSRTSRSALTARP